MKKRIIGILFLVLASIIISMPYVKANEVSNNTVIGKITDDSKTVEQNKSVFVEMDIDNIENVKSITGYIASTTDSEQYITVELQNSTQGTWYYFIVPSTTVIGQTYIMPMIQVVYEDGTIITGKATGEFKVLQQELEDNSKVIGKITDDSKAVEQNKSVFVEMNIDNIENVKSITGYIASTTDSEQYITVELQNSTQGTWYYFIVPSTTVIGQTYIMPMIQVVYEDGTIITGKATGEFKVLQQKLEDNSKVIGKITDDSKTVEKNKSVFVEMDIDNIENVKSITGYIASVTNPEQYITVELQNSTQGTWYYFIMPSTAIVGETYTMPMIQVVYEDGTTITGKVTGEIKVVENNEKFSSLDNTDNTTAKGILPKTGKNMIIGLVCALVAFLIIMIIRNKKYKNIG